MNRQVHPTQVQSFYDGRDDIPKFYPEEGKTQVVLGLPSYRSPTRCGLGIIS
jgi:hypothetical protein